MAILSHTVEDFEPTSNVSGHRRESSRYKQRQEMWLMLISNTFRNAYNKKMEKGLLIQQACVYLSSKILSKQVAVACCDIL